VAHGVLDKCFRFDRASEDQAPPMRIPTISWKFSYHFSIPIFENGALSSDILLPTKEITFALAPFSRHGYARAAEIRSNGGLASISVLSLAPTRSADFLLHFAARDSDIPQFAWSKTGQLSTPIVPLSSKAAGSVLSWPPSTVETGAATDRPGHKEAYHRSDPTAPCRLKLSSVKPKNVFSFGCW